MVASTISKQVDAAYRESSPGTTRTILLKPNNPTIGGTRAIIRQGKIQLQPPKDISNTSRESQFCKPESKVCQSYLFRQTSNASNGNESTGAISTHDAANYGLSTSLPFSTIQMETSPEYDTSKRRREREFNMQTYIRFFMGAPRSQKLVIVTLVLWFIFSIIRMIRFSYRKLQGERLPPPQKLDFLVAGFPKSGTTTLLETLRLHPEVAMDSQENCQIARPIQQDDVNLKRLNRYLFALKKEIADDRKFHSSLRRLGSLPSSASKVLDPESLKAGIKCPDAVKNFKAIHRLSQHSPGCKFIIGVRHPIMFVQSFYNYRLLEAHVKNRPDIPSLFEIWNSNMNWWDVSRDSPRYEMFLAQFGKTSVSLDQLSEWFIERPMLAVKPNNFKVFLYSIEQIEDPSQSHQLRSELQEFLGLSEPIAKFGHENRIDSNAKKITKHIDICSPEFSYIRKDILNHAGATVSWMHDFLQSPDVVVSDRQHVLKSINSWVIDPCEDATIMAI